MGAHELEKAMEDLPRRYQLVRQLGEGVFGMVFLAKDVDSKRGNATAAVKILSDPRNQEKLEREAAFLKLLCGKRGWQQQGIARYLASGPTFLVMERLGETLQHWWEHQGNLSEKTIVLLAEQIFQRIEYVHSKGIVHCDLKPDNFMFGNGGKLHHLYLVDFGSSIQWWEDGKQVPIVNVGAKSSRKWGSINALRNGLHSRVGDLEAIGYMLLSFSQGLPWDDLEVYSKYGKRPLHEWADKKEEFLCEWLRKPKTVLQKYMSYVCKLDFAERPDYDMIERIWKNARLRCGNPRDHQYDFLEALLKEQGACISNLIPLEPRRRIRQPDSPAEKKSKKFTPSDPARMQPKKKYSSCVQSLEFVVFASSDFHFKKGHVQEAVRKADVGLDEDSTDVDSTTTPCSSSSADEPEILDQQHLLCRRRRVSGKCLISGRKNVSDSVSSEEERDETACREQMVNLRLTGTKKLDAARKQRPAQRTGGRRLAQSRRRSANMELLALHELCVF